MREHQSGWRSALWPTGVFFIGFILIYGLSFLRLGLHQDEILDFYGQATDTYTAAGRWATTLYRSVFGLGASVWAAPMMTAVWLSLAVAVQVKLFDLKGRSEQVLFALFSLLINQFAYLVVYSFLSDVLALGLLCASLSAYVFFKYQGSLLLRGGLSIALLCFSLGTYQANALYFGVLALGCLFIQYSRENKLVSLRMLISLAVVSGAAVVLWAIIRACTMGLASPEALEYTLSYQEGMSQWGNFPELSWKMRALFIAHYTKMMLLEACGLVHGGQWLNAASLLALMMLAWRAIKQKAAWFALLLLGAIWLLPYALTLGLGTVQDARTHVAGGLSVAFLCTMAWRGFSPAWQQKALPVLGIVFAFLFMKSMYWASEKAKFEAHYYQLVTQQLQRMENLRQHLSYEQGKDLELAVVWSEPAQAASEEFSQPSFGAPLLPVGVLNWYATHLQLNHVRAAEDGDAAIYTQPLAGKSVWPSYESIYQHGDTIYIKVGLYYERPKMIRL